MGDFNKTSNIYPNLNAVPLSAHISNQQQFRLNKINEIKDYFLADIRERDLISKNLSKYIASLDYFDKSLNVLSILSGSISIASFASVIGVTGVIGTSCSFTFSITSGFVKRFLKTKRIKKKKHNKVVMLARSKLNSVEKEYLKHWQIMKLVMKTLIQLLVKKKKYWELKESIRMTSIQRSDAKKVNLIEEGKKK